MLSLFLPPRLRDKLSLTSQFQRQALVWRLGNPLPSRPFLGLPINNSKLMTTASALGMLRPSYGREAVPWLTTRVPSRPPPRLQSSNPSRFQPRSLGPGPLSMWLEYKTAPICAAVAPSSAAQPSIFARPYQLTRRHPMRRHPLELELAHRHPQGQPPLQRLLPHRFKGR